MNVDYLNRLYIDNRFLKTLTIEVVNHCNLSCMHCYLNKDKLQIPKEKIFEMIESAKKCGLFELKLSGGELMLHKDICEIIEFARKNYLNVVLLSNMTILSQEVIECIKKYQVSRVETTIFSLDDDVNDSFVGVKGSLKKTLNNIAILKSLGVDILVKIWAIKSNINELENMKSHFEHCGYSVKILTQIYADLQGVHKLPSFLELSIDDYSKALYLSDQSQFRRFPLKNRLNCKLCDEFSYSIYVCANGDIVPCAKYRKKLGNIYDDDLMSIWKLSPQLKKIQKYQWNDLDECRNCKRQGLCLRCGAMSEIENVNFLKNCDETCKLAMVRDSKYYKKWRNYYEKN